MSQKIRNRTEGNEYQHAKEVCRFLKSLSEARNMLICVTLSLRDAGASSYKENAFSNFIGKLRS